MKNFNILGIHYFKGWGGGGREFTKNQCYGAIV